MKEKEGKGRLMKGKLRREKQPCLFRRKKKRKRTNVSILLQNLKRLYT